MRVVWICLWLLVAAGQATAQSSEVRPGELELRVEIEERDHVPLEREMILITIKGLYRRHITRETLEQPDFEGFSWAQLGPDKWTEEQVRGKMVKVFERRMALYPDKPGRLTIGAFTHRLTLTDEGDDWFDHAVTSEPVTVEVEPRPEVEGWWFPVRSLQISDAWSNAPELLSPGEGVLRVVRVEALGVTPEMIPPMPELTSPSAMIFPHPEKRLVELSPAGPITYAFWRWTIRPTNNTSTIVEPFTVHYFDAMERVQRSVTISAQRVAYGEAVPDESMALETVPTSARLPGMPIGILALCVFTAGVGGALWGRETSWRQILKRVPLLDPDAIRLRRAAARKDATAFRRAGTVLMNRDGATPGRRQALSDLDREIYSRSTAGIDFRDLARRFLASG